MRLLAALPLLIAAACGGEEADPKQAAAKAAQLDAGQWELASEVTAFRAADSGTPRIDAPVGTRATHNVCVGDGRPPAELFAGEGYDCRYGDYYLRNGRINVTLSCTREGLEGGIPIMVDGRFDARTAEFTRNIRTALVSDGDVEIAVRVTGRRTGECAPEVAAGNQAG